MANKSDVTKDVLGEFKAWAKAADPVGATKLAELADGYVGELQAAEAKAAEEAAAAKEATKAAKASA